MSMLAISLALNIVVLLPVFFALAANAPTAGAVWGPDTPARRILGAIYATILGASALLLALLLLRREVDAWAQALLGIQIVYKLLTAPLVGLANPVARFNVAIALLHIATLSTILHAI